MKINDVEIDAQIVVYGITNETESWPDTESGWIRVRPTGWICLDCRISEKSLIAIEKEFPAILSVCKNFPMYDGTNFHLSINTKEYQIKDQNCMELKYFNHPWIYNVSGGHGLGPEARRLAKDAFNSKVKES